MSKPDTSTTDDTHSFAESHDDYEKVLSVVKHNTGHAQPAMASRSSILQTAVSPDGLDSDTVHAKLGAADRNDDLESWHGRVFLTTTDALWDVVEAEAEATHPRRGLIKRIIELEAGKEDSDEDLVGECNRLLHGGDDA